MRSSSSHIQHLVCAMLVGFIVCFILPGDPDPGLAPSNFTHQVETVRLSGPPSVDARAADRALTWPSHQATPVKARAMEAFHQLPLSFEANEGQADARVKFLSRGSGYQLF